MSKPSFPPVMGDRGVWFWLRPSNWAATRSTAFRPDYSNEWRYAEEDQWASNCTDPANRREHFERLLLKPKKSGEFRFVVLGDTGEGDHSQYGSLPLLKGLQPDFMIINGDVAYPAGRLTGRGDGLNDYEIGFFKPYRNMGVPIWAVPGNHEYYNWDSNILPFIRLFCERGLDGEYWEQYGLPHIPQPGTYWELSDKDDGDSNLVLLALDTGMDANLDAHKRLWFFNIGADDSQHEWLDRRLSNAQGRNKSVVVMFHIPALVNGAHHEEHLNRLHQIIAKYSCVKLVLSAHIHNYQSYAPEVFARYLKVGQGAAEIPPDFGPRYIVCGGGGAFLHSTKFDDSEYQCERFPSEDDWEKLKALPRLAGTLGKATPTFSRFMHKIGEIGDTLLDRDEANYISFILFDVFRDSASGDLKTKVTPVWMRTLDQFLRDWAPNTEEVDVWTMAPPPDSQAVMNCLKLSESFLI